MVQLPYLHRGCHYIQFHLFTNYTVPSFRAIAPVRRVHHPRDTCSGPQQVGTPHVSEETNGLSHNGFLMVCIVGATCNTPEGCDPPHRRAARKHRHAYVMSVTIFIIYLHQFLYSFIQFIQFIAPSRPKDIIY